MMRCKIFGHRWKKVIEGRLLYRSDGTETVEYVVRMCERPNCGYIEHAPIPLGSGAVMKVEIR